MRVSDVFDRYPGSSKPRVTPQAAPDRARDGVEWDAKPRIYTVAGKETEFFTVGQLARALGREAVTIRKWEREGVIPRAQFNAPSDDVRGRRRLYTRAQVEGIVRIALEEGVMGANHQMALKSTRFTEKVIDLFKSLGAPGSENHP
jgi:hypothetical protein